MEVKGASDKGFGHNRTVGAVNTAGAGVWPPTSNVEDLGRTLKAESFGGSSGDAVLMSKLGVYPGSVELPLQDNLQAPPAEPSRGSKPSVDSQPPPAVPSRGSKPPVDSQPPPAVPSRGSKPPPVPMRGSKPPAARFAEADTPVDITKEFPVWLRTAASGDLSKIDFDGLVVSDFSNVHELPLDNSAIFFAVVQGQAVVVKPLTSSHTISDSIPSFLLSRPVLQELLNPVPSVVLPKAREGTHPSDDVVTAALENPECGFVTGATEQERFLSNQSYQVQPFLKGHSLRGASVEEKVSLFQQSNDNLKALGGLVGMSMMLNDHDHLPHFDEGHSRSMGNSGNLMVQDGKLQLIDMGSFSRSSKMGEHYNEQMQAFGRSFVAELTHPYFARLEQFLGVKLDEGQREVVISGFKAAVNHFVDISDSEIESSVANVRGSMGAAVNEYGIPSEDAGLAMDELTGDHIAGLKRARDGFKELQQTFL